MKHTAEQIEDLRLLMQEVASDKDLTDQRVVSISEELDVLIYEFYTDKTCARPLPCHIT